MKASESWAEVTKCYHGSMVHQSGLNQNAGGPNRNMLKATPEEQQGDFGCL